MAEQKRDSALLTPSQRAVLQGEKDISDRGERAARARILDRLQNSLLDFRLIFEYLEENDRDKIIPDDAHEQAMLHDGMVAAIALFYELHEYKGWPFAELLERSVEDVYKNSERSPERMIVDDVEFDLTLESPRTRKEVERAALQKFLRGAELTDREFRVLTEPPGMIVDPETDEYLKREDILEAIRNRREERREEERREESRKRIELDQEIFGEGYSIPSDIQEKLDDE